LRCVALRCVALHCVALRFALRFALRCVALCFALRCGVRLMNVISTCFRIGTKSHLGGSEARFCTNWNMRRNLCRHDIVDLKKNRRKSQFIAVWFVRLSVYVISTCFVLHCVLRCIALRCSFNERDFYMF
jgi:hypothetical protein